MDTKPFFSIVIPTLNEERALPDLLDDIKKQKMNSVEIIVVDAFSDDRTVEVARALQTHLSNMKILLSKTRNNAYQRNLGARQAKGRWIIFVDADTRLPNGFLKSIKDQIEDAGKDFEVFTCAMVADTNRLDDRLSANIINSFIWTMEAVNSPGAVGALIGCTGSSFNKNTKFDEKIGLAEDGLFVRNMVKNGYVFKYLESPKFVFSMRRFRSNGHIRTIFSYIRLHIKQKLLKKQIDVSTDYPMGGHIH